MHEGFAVRQFLQFYFNSACVGVARAWLLSLGAKALETWLWGLPEKEDGACGRPGQSVSVCRRGPFTSMGLALPIDVSVLFVWRCSVMSSVIGSELYFQDLRRGRTHF